jgi:hypothetical protein
MKASELRIGNLVMDGKDIEQVNSRMIDMIVKIEADFDPIPLTEEWFLKFGLLKTKEGIILMGCYQIVAHEESWRIILKNGVLSNIKYVHQLQNLYFALRGEELKQQEQTS